MCARSGRLEETKYRSYLVCARLGHGSHRSARGQQGDICQPRIFAFSCYNAASPPETLQSRRYTFLKCRHGLRILLLCESRQLRQTLWAVRPAPAYARCSPAARCATAHIHRLLENVTEQKVHTPKFPPHCRVSSSIVLFTCENNLSKRWPLTTS
jgi:hypothetical protein